jgi:S-adenosylmethionine:tRNA ribosyltransferase-isomerase
LRVDLFDFDLPEDRIALRPVRPRDAARLLHVRPRQPFEDLGVRDLPRLLRAGDALVFNDTKVIPAQLFGLKGAARIGVTLHRRIDDWQWWAFVRNARKLGVGDLVDFGRGLVGAVAEKLADGQVRFAFRADEPDLVSALHTHGVMPLPPYIANRRAADAEDEADYQTVYAAKAGSVAAPTAGLHFTDRLLAAVDAAGIARITVTLHVGAGTFLPVKADDTCDHRMHLEWGLLDRATADRLNAVRHAGGRIVAVGTTALRLLESATDERGIVQPFEGETGIFITPGYRFRCVDGLMTNFHLPRSTLFMLVSALAGLDTMQAAYAHAIGSGYRFYSYGDTSLLWKASEETGGHD